MQSNIKADNMQPIHFQAQEVIDYFKITPADFVRLFDRGRLPAEMVDGRIVFEFHALKKVDFTESKKLLYQEQGLATIAEALYRLDISRRTFYLKVAKGEIQIHKQGRRSFVKLQDLYTTDELF